ncbi:tannase and feruloyl esterase [Mycena belliarum]|uniref:Carboxylic ester hydrolase n=1 Tax=Mycena belliarum TaxID=1033014 RepID=A0AAD6TUX2_9AGAR|nr:tannase and feruloyl esterase [Mycena belliae]
MEFAVGILSKLLLSVGVLSSSWNVNEEARSNCLALKSSLQALRLENTTILDVSYPRVASRMKARGTCFSAATTIPLCRVQFNAITSDTSGIEGEVWLPDEWNARFMAFGNRGLSGCIPYDELDYGSSLKFAVVASNSGHEGDTVLPFFQNPEVLNDFSFRSIHIEAVIGKQIVEAYYGRPQDKSYYLGCSTGGRQGIKTALQYPGDFDGIIAGAPAADFNHLLHWTGMLSRYIGAPKAPSSPSFIPVESWKFIAKEVLRQCDGIDGVVDGIVDEPDACDFRPEALLCGTDVVNGKHCLTVPQVEALRKIYSPLYGVDGELLYPRYDPGAEGSPLISFALSGSFPPYTEEWLKYVVLNVTDYDIDNYALQHHVLMDTINPGGISSFDGDFSAFRDRGGKLLTYHGRADAVIPSGFSKRLYNLISRTLSMPSLDSFYRLFNVPGMDHCEDGIGASRFGQLPASKSLNDSSHNIILALVDWVENGVAPDVIIGTARSGATREHCRYPMKSMWNGSSFRCQG